MKLVQVRRGLSCAVMCAVMCAVLSGLAACSSTPKKDDVAAKLAVQEQVGQNMAAADEAVKQGKTDQAIAQLDLAIQADPAAKAPWLKKAQIHFDARQYGLAITEAQEVLQRDVNDLTAKSILAVSGLRVSAQALEQLRKANEVNGSTRSEAESVARLIHEALGEAILVPQAAASASSEAAASAAKPQKTAPRYVRSPRGAASTRSAHAAPAPANPPVASATSSSVSRSTGAVSGRNNPFGALQ